MQVGMPPQSAIALVQLPAAKFGHCATSQPIAANDGSLPSASAVPQILSFPPQALTIVAASFVRAFAIAGAVFDGSLAQTVACGRRPFTLASSQRCSAVAARWVNAAAAPTIAALHFTAGSTAASAIEPWPAVAATTETTATRVEMRWGRDIEGPERRAALENDA